MGLCRAHLHFRDYFGSSIALAVSGNDRVPSYRYRPSCSSVHANIRHGRCSYAAVRRSAGNITNRRAASMLAEAFAATLDNTLRTTEEVC